MSANFLQNNFKTHVYPSSVEFLLCILGLVIGCRVLLELDTSFGFIDWFETNILTQFFNLKPLPSELLACTVYGIMIWLAKATIMRYTLKMLLIYKGWMFEYRGPKGEHSKYDSLKQIN